MEFVRNLQFSQITQDLLQENKKLKEERDHYKVQYEKYCNLEGLQFIPLVTLDDILTKMSNTAKNLEGIIEELNQVYIDNENLKDKCRHLYDDNVRLSEKLELGNIKGEKRKCPLCREFSFIPSSNVHVKGIDQKCSICMEKEVQIYFSSCGHLPCCADCEQKIVE